MDPTIARMPEAGDSAAETERNAQSKTGGERARDQEMLHGERDKWEVSVLGAAGLSKSASRIPRELVNPF